MQFSMQAYTGDLSLQSTKYAGTLKTNTSLRPSAQCYMAGWYYVKSYIIKYNIKSLQSSFTENVIFYIKKINYQWRWLFPVYVHVDKNGR